jgi:hypothetical protein
MPRVYTRRFRACGGRGTRHSARKQVNTGNLMKYWAGVGTEINKEDESVFTSTANASTYGYLTIPGFQTILQQYRAHGGREAHVFYDLGSGLGIPNVIAASLIPTLLKSVGVELSSQRVREANQVLNAVRADYPSLAARVHFINGDILSTQWSYADADMIWISSLCFSSDVADKIAARLNSELRKGTHVFTSKIMPKLAHSQYNQFTAEMSWTSESVVNHYIL